MGSISGIAGSILQQTVFQTSGLTGNSGTNSTSFNSSSSDKNQLSPLAQVLGDLQTLQQTDPAKYKNVTGQIAVKLQAAADADTASGNTAGASQLTKLASDFATASKTGQLPNLEDVAKAVGGGHHHHHGHGGAPPASTDQDASSTATAAASQAQAAYQSLSSSGPSTSTNPLAIILSSLSN